MFALLMEIAAEMFSGIQVSMWRGERRVERIPWPSRDGSVNKICFAGLDNST